MDKENFLQCIESLKKYRRAELERGDENLIEKLYTDLLPDNYILKKSLLRNTTFLIGRKGTGKSTIFLMIEKDIEKQNDLISCMGQSPKSVYKQSATAHVLYKFFGAVKLLTT